MTTKGSSKIPLRRADIALTLVLLGIAAVAAVAAAHTGIYAADAKVVVTVDGELYGIYALAEEQEIRIDGNYRNEIRIEADAAGHTKVRVAEADCPGQDCVHHAPIDRKGQRIVCLPNKMIVEIRDGEGTIDAYTY
jgi:hypothetical protein